MKVFATGAMPKVVKEIFRENGIEFSQFISDSPISEDELAQAALEVDGLITMLSDRIDGALMSSITNLKVIANYAAGFNNIDMQKAKQLGVVVTNTPDILTDATAEIAMLLVLAASRRLTEGQKFIRGGHFKGWMPSLLLGMGLTGKTIGIIGAGRIGQATAKRALCFGMKILYYSRTRKIDFENETGALFLSLEDLLRNSDVVSLHIPLTEETSNLLNAGRLALLKNTAILINTARGEVLDEDCLIQMLADNKIFAAGFDTYRNEPSINPGFMKLDNVVLLPHIGSATVEARNEMARLCAENIVLVLKGEKPLTQVI